MKSYTVICFFLSLAMILFPLVSVEKATEFFSSEFSEKEVTETTIKAEEVVEKNVTVKVMNANSKNITELSLKDYLIGVASEEINAAYHEEAIKAQIVAAHTKLEYTKLHKNDDLGEADITDSATSYQGFLTEEEQREKWGKSYDVYHGKIEECVDEVLNVILVYENEPINAVFHAISNGQTENSADVWGGDFPYLVSVDSTGDKLSPAYKSEVTISSEDFKKKLIEEDVELGKKPEKWIEKITNTETGMVKNIVIGGKSFKGTEIRKIFDLRSSTFSVKYDDGNFIFTVNGYGHGVGMSQYGANYMAQQGLSYKQILAHYYKNAECVTSDT
ncbi:MAG: stage II sporulation protein D [Clostridia bacterium]|nr:stage II sporulation protein D [Clostridia bacterium]